MISRKPVACLTTVLCLCLFKHPCFAQDKDKVKHVLDKVTVSDFAPPASPIIDSNTKAVILSDQGEVHYIGNSRNWFSCVYTRHTKILIIRKTAFDLAKKSFYLSGTEEKGERLSDLQGATYNLEKGQVVATNLDPKDVFVNKEKTYRETKFTLPGVKEGSIVEYTYTTISPYSDDLPSWRFQWEDYPCLTSEYKVEIPETMSFVAVRQGLHPYSTDKGSTGTIVYKVVEKVESGLTNMEDAKNVTATTIKHDWVMSKIPAFGEEAYLTTPENYLDKISFQLSSTNDGERSTDENNTWSKATESLLADSHFCGTLGDDNSELDRVAASISGRDGNETALAKAVYYYVSQHLTCTDPDWPHLTSDLTDVIKNNGGTVGDINLLLIALFRRKGLKADPVLLSTREHGFNLVSYPLLDKLNYVIVRLDLSGMIYYLDAAHPQLGFGQLAGNCYNGHARVISKRDSASVFLWADSLKESKVTMVLMEHTDKGFEGELQTTLGPEESYELRRGVAEQGQVQYFKDIQTQIGEDAEIINAGIDSLTRLEDPVKLHFDLLLKQQADASVIYLNPVLAGGWRENPFKAADRKYPVEMPYVTDQTYVFSMDIPSGYVVDELPKSAKVALNGDQGYFEYLIQAQGDKIQMRCRVRLSKAVFPPEDYGSLRDFFAFIVKKENEQIVLKKK